MKRGIKGPTRHIWRRRWISLDEESGRLYYYKENSDVHPQGLASSLTGHTLAAAADCMCVVVSLTWI